MHRKNQVVLLFIFFSLLFSCTASKISKPEKTTADKSNGPDQIIAKASNEAKITAVLISIKDLRDSSDLSSPCFKAPCFAVIRIEKLERKGSLFQVPESTEITAYFAFTLHPTTEDLFPNSGKQFPGLKINDKFEAIIDSRPSLNGGTRYNVYDYKKLQ